MEREPACRCVPASLCTGVTELSVTLPAGLSVVRVSRLKLGVQFFGLVKYEESQ